MTRVLPCTADWTRAAACNRNLALSVRGFASADLFDLALAVFNKLGEVRDEDHSWSVQVRAERKFQMWLMLCLCTSAQAPAGHFT